MVKKSRLILIGLFLILILAGETLRIWPTKDLQVVFCDVGQGDATLILWPSGPRILIDGGPDKKILNCLGRFLPPGDKKIDIMILSHSDADHSGGLFDVLAQYDVGEVWSGDDGGRNPAYQAFLLSVEQKNINLKKVLAGQSFSLNNNQLKILWPPNYDSQATEPDPNNMSVVLQIMYDQTRWLFVGDIEEPTENWLIRSGQDLSSQVLKVGHHGSNTSSTVDFLSAVKPRVAVISVGKDNKFGHPSAMVLNSFYKIKAIIKRTDQDGDIILASDGKNIYDQQCLDFWPFVCYARGTNLN